MMRKTIRRFNYALMAVIFSSIIVAPPIFADVGYTWTDDTPSGAGHNLDWSGIATSSTGQNQVAIVGNSDIYTSNNYGSTWTDATPSGTGHNQAWVGVASSSSGQYLAATSNGGIDRVFMSSNYGATWTLVGPNVVFQSITMSSSGQYMAATVLGGDTYTSNNYGSTWIDATPSGVAHNIDPTGITSSSSGQYLAISTAFSNGDIYTSNNYGSTWIDATPSGTGHNAGYSAITTTSTGQYIIGVVHGGDIYISSNYGSTWTDATPSGTGHNLPWQAVASSYNGQYMTAAAFGGDIYTSSNYGSTWTDATPSGTGHNQYWAGMASSLTGQYVSAVVLNGDIYTGSDSSLVPTTEESLTNPVSGGGVVVNTPGGTTITGSGTVTETSLASQDSYSYPVGLAGLSFDTVNSNNQVTITFATDLTPSEVIARDYNSQTNTYSTVSGATITQTTLNGQPALSLSYNIADNGPLDSNSAVGSITDPVGLAALPHTVSATAPATGFGLYTPDDAASLIVYSLGLTSLLTVAIGIRKLNNCYTDGDVRQKK